MYYTTATMITLMILGAAAVGLVISALIDSLSSRAAMRQLEEVWRARDDKDRQEERTHASAVIGALMEQCKTLVSANLALMAENEGIKALVAKELARGSHDPQQPIEQAVELQYGDGEAEDEDAPFEGVVRNTPMGDE